MDDGIIVSAGSKPGKINRSTEGSKAFVFSTVQWQHKLANGKTLRSCLRGTVP